MVKRVIRRVIRRKISRTRPAVVKRAVKRANNAAFKKKVLKVMRGQVESKQAFHTQPTINFNSGVTAAADAIRIIPNVSIGTGDNARIGDQIRPQSLTLRGIIQMLPQGGNQGDGVRKIAARVMIITPKAFPTWASASANATTWQQYLLKKGGTTTQFTGALDDLFAPMNTDAITCHYNKVFYFNQSSYMSIGGSTSGTVATTQDNLVRFFKKTIKFGANRVFKYDSGVDTGLTPSNGPAYVLLVGYCFVDGTSPDTINQRISMQFDSTLNYEDA